MTTAPLRPVAEKKKKKWSNDRAWEGETDPIILNTHPVVGAWEALDGCPELTYADEINDNTAKDPVVHGSI